MLAFLYFITTHINIIFIKKIIAGAKMNIATPTVMYLRDEMTLTTYSHIYIKKQYYICTRQYVQYCTQQKWYVMSPCRVVVYIHFKYHGNRRKMRLL